MYCIINEFSCERVSHTCFAFDFYLYTLFVYLFVGSGQHRGGAAVARGRHEPLHSGRGSVDARAARPPPARTESRPSAHSIRRTVCTLIVTFICGWFAFVSQVSSRFQTLVRVFGLPYPWNGRN